MDELRIAIIDDEKPARSELKYLILLSLPEAEITEISSGEEALEVFSKATFDLLLIDINLGDISGTILASTVHKLMPEAEIVFATAYNTYAEKAFEVDAMYYLLKPYSEDKVMQMIERYESRQRSLPEVPSISFSKIPLNIDKKTIMMDISDVVYIESQNRVCIIHTISGDYQDNNTLNYFEEKLMSKGFFRIQKSYLVNLNHVKEMYPWFNGTYCIKMNGYRDDTLPVSRKKIKHLKELLCI